MDRLSRVVPPARSRAAGGRGGNAPDADAAEPARCARGDDRVRRIRDVDAVAIAFRTIDGPLPERGPGDITAAVFRCTPHAKCNAWRNAARGVSGVGFRPCNDVTGRFFGAGLEPATAELEIRSSTRLSYPVVDEPDSNRRPAAWSRYSPSELSSARETPSPDPRQYATAAPRAPDGLWNPCRCGPFERCSALASRRRSQFVCECIRLPPVPKHPGTAHEAPSRLSLPRTSTVRMLRGARCNRDKPS